MCLPSLCRYEIFRPPGRTNHACAVSSVCFCLVFRSLAIVICNSVLSMLQRMVDFRFLPVCVWGHAQWPLTFWDLLDCSNQAPLSMGFSRQEDWNGLPFPPPGFFPTQDRGGIQKLSLIGPTFSLWLLKKISFHVLRHREAIPAHTWVNLDSMLTNIYVT